MAIETPSAPTHADRPRIVGMRCRNCGAEPADRPVLRLSGLFRSARGRLRLRGRRRDADARGDRRTRARHLALRRAAPGRRAAGARPARRLDAAAGRRPAGPDARPRSAVDQGRHAQSVASASRTGRSRSRRRGPSSSASRRCACASTGNLAGATAAAAAALGLPAYVFIPADLEPAKVDHALAYGATVVPIEGTYDDVNRLCLEVADETGWGFVNINLRPFYAEGSKTLAYEIAESLGWRSPDVVVAPGRVGGDVHAGRPRLRGAGRAGPDRATADPLRRWPGRRLRAGRDGVGGRDRRHRAGPDAGHDRPLAGHRQPGRRPLRGRAGQRDRRLGRGDRRRGDRRGDPRRGAARGHLPGDGRWRDLGRGRRGAAPRRDPARRRGGRPADRQRAQDAGRADARRTATAIAGPGQPGLAPAIRPSLSAFERWLGGDAS